MTMPMKLAAKIGPSPPSRVTPTVSPTWCAVVVAAVVAVMVVVVKFGISWWGRGRPRRWGARRRVATQERRVAHKSGHH